MKRGGVAYHLMSPICTCMCCQVACIFWSCTCTVCMWWLHIMCDVIYWDMIYDIAISDALVVWSCMMFGVRVSMVVSTLFELLLHLLASEPVPVHVHGFRWLRLHGFCRESCGCDVVCCDCCWWLAMTHLSKGHLEGDVVFAAIKWGGLSLWHEWWWMRGQVWC